ncbi:nitroreductase family protein [Seleniivibrio sp.]|uniref:nitroreductase family protein n=1 Tax=Seleniivibrio sp. TaxID=2898801 RepID=UPI0025D41E2C|nr:nitroreductase family protein [Seleniivibrio sp.]MCD8553694.1 nitroreductase family protein [Seleniivibrio sp.]
MLNFIVSESKCTSCKACVADCPAMIIELTDKIPFIKPENEKKCYKCQHCLAICPTAAVSILGVDPDTCVSPDKAADFEQVDALIRTRRTVRKFKNTDVSAEKLDKITKAAANAPTGKNDHQVQLVVVDSREQMDKFKEMVISVIEKADKEGKLNEHTAIFGVMAKHFRNGKDIIFRGAPHIIFSVTPKTAPTPLADGFIALTYAELAAASLGVGTVWAGFVMWLTAAFPEILTNIGIEDDVQLSYALLLGEPAIKYHRGVQRDEIIVRKVKLS